LARRGRVRQGEAGIFIGLHREHGEAGGDPMNNEGERFDATGLAHARSFKLFFCGRCPHGHVVFLGEADEPLLSATLSSNQARRLAEMIEERDPNFREAEP
jgi:hypothetical protein